MLPLYKFGLALCVTILCFIDLGHSLECVFCNSTEYSVDQECVKGSVPPKIACSYDTPCFYAIYELGGSAAGRPSKIAYRGCMYAGDSCSTWKRRVQSMIQRPIYSEECRTCNTHLCNSATSLYTFSVISCIVYLITRIF